MRDDDDDEEGSGWMVGDTDLISIHLNHAIDSHANESRRDALTAVLGARGEHGDVAA